MNSNISENYIFSFIFNIEYTKIYLMSSNPSTIEGMWYKSYTDWLETLSFILNWLLRMRTDMFNLKHIMCFWKNISAHRKALLLQKQCFYFNTTLVVQVMHDSRKTPLRHLRSSRFKSNAAWRSGAIRHEWRLRGNFDVSDSYGARAILKFNSFVLKIKV